MKSPPWIARAFLALTLLTTFISMQGCDSIAEMIGAPTSKQAKEAAAALEAADKEIEALTEQKAVAEKRTADLTKKADELVTRRQMLEQMQADLAAKLATAPAAAKPLLRKSISEVDAMIEGLEDQNAQIAAMLTSYQEELLKVQLAESKFRKEIAVQETKLASMGDETKAAIERTQGAITNLGGIVGNYVPGAGAVSDGISNAFGIVASVVGTGGATLIANRVLNQRRARKHAEELEEVEAERDGARKVIAITERFGLESIASDEATRKAAKAAIMGNDNARREFALAKAEAFA